MRKRIWSLCIVLVLCLGLLPGLTLTASAAASTTIYVGGQALTGSSSSPAYATTDTAGNVTLNGSASNYNIKWDGSTLTLQNATINGTSVLPVADDNTAYAIAHEGDFAIVLTGTNTVTANLSSSNDIRTIYAAPDDSFSEDESQVSGDGGSLTISGTGSLQVTGGTATVDEYGSSDSYGIYAEKSVTIQSGTVTATGGQAVGSYGIYAGEGSVIAGGTVTAKGGDVTNTGRSAYSYGISGAVTVQAGAVLTATGGTANGSSAYSYGISGDVTVSGGALTATGGTASGTYGAYSYGIAASNTTVSGGALTAKGSTATSTSDSWPSTSSGICVYMGGTLSITGGSVTATGGTAGIYAYTNGKVTVGSGLDVYTGSSESDREKLSFTPGANIASSLSSKLYFYCEETPLSVSISVSGEATKTYDGQAVTLTASVTGATGTVSYQWYKDDQVVENATGSTLSVKDVADSGTYTVTVTADGHSANSPTQTVSISKATPTISITNKTAVYTGTRITMDDQVTVTLAGDDICSPSDLIVGYYLDEEMTDYDSPLNVGTYYVTATYRETSNYFSAENGVATLTITPAALTATAVTAAGKAYDGTATVEITDVTLSGTVGGDEVRVDMSSSSLTGTVSSADVGTYTELTLTGTAVLTGDDAANYTLPLPNEPVTVTNGVTIHKATSSISFNDYAPSRAYNGAALANPTAGELNLTGAAYSDVTFTWYKDSVEEGNELDSAPADAGTYYLVASIPDGDNTSASEVTSGEITISPATISISGATLATKTYDGTTAAEVENVTFTGVAVSPTGDDYTVTAAEFENKNAGTYSSGTVTVTLTNGNFTFADGAATADYASATGTISPLPVELEWGTTSFTYDGQEHSVTATIKNLVGSDNVTLTYETNAATAVGSYTATVSGLGGDDAANYTLTGASGVEQGWSIDGVSIAGAEVTLDQDSFTYNGQSQTPTVTVTLGGENLIADTDYTVAFSDDTTSAGTVTVTVTGAGNYAGTASITYTIQKADPAIGDVTYSGEDPYESTALGSITLSRSGTAVDGTLALDAGQTLTAGTHDYKWTFTPTDATNYETVKGTVQLTVRADALLSLSIRTNPSKTEYVYGETFDPTGLVLEATYESGNKKEISAAEITVVTTGPLTCDMTEVTVSYQGMECTVPVTVEKAEATDAMQTASGAVLAGYSGTVTLPDIPDGASYGTPSYSGSDGAVTGLTITDGVLSYTGGSSITVGQEYTITVQVTGATNYYDYTITVTLTGTDKIVPTGAPTLSTTAITYGEALSTITLSGTMQDGENNVPGTFAWDVPETTPDAGSYWARWTFTPDNGDLYEPVSGTVTITVNKATPTGAPQYAAITSSGKTLADAGLTTEGGTFSVSGTVAWELGDTTQVQANTAYTWIFTPTDSNNYSSISGSVILYVVSSGGSGSSGGTASKTPSQQAADKIEAAKDGSTVEITLSTGNTSLDKEVFEELSGKDVTLEISLSNGVTWTVNGQDIPANADLTDLDIGVSMNTSAIPGSVINTISGEMDVIQLALKHDGAFGFTMTLTAPLGKAYAGYWANLYWYNEDTRELEFQSADKIASDGTAEFPFDHASDYAIVIDTESHEPVELPFTDVADSYWAYDEIAWAYENGYMSGTAATTFNPGGTVSRQQVWMILARMAGAAPSDMAAAKAWAVANGVSDGTNPGGAVTRQQLAALLYRYAALSGYDVSVGEDTNILSYTDFADLSEYAVPAMQWACGAGIINGTGDGSTLSPQGTATRAQLAVMLYRWLA